MSWRPASCCSVTFIGASATVTDSGVGLLSLLVIPVATAAAHRPQVVWATAGFAAVIALASVVINGPRQALDHPIFVLTVLAVLAGVTAVTTALMDAEWQIRNQSVLDPLTGLLNDDHGHERGDAVLREVSAPFAELAAQLRAPIAPRGEEPAPAPLSLRLRRSTLAASA